jgi:hypothetical protein
MDLTGEIKQFIDDMPDDYGFSKDDAKYISRYTGCPIPPFAYITKIQEMVKEHFPFICMKGYRGEDVRALCFGFGSDRVLSNTNAIITSYQDDYYCFRVTQGVHYDKVVQGEHSVSFRNLADYFIDFKGNNKRYDVVVTFPKDEGEFFATETTYHEIDADERFSKLSSCAYYTLRGVFFMKPKGILFSIVPSEYVNEIESNKHLISSENVKVTSDNDGDYAIIKIIKQ